MHYMLQTMLGPGSAGTPSATPGSQPTLHILTYRLLSAQAKSPSHSCHTLYSETAGAPFCWGSLGLVQMWW